MADEHRGRAVAARLGRVGIWSFQFERQTAAVAQEFARQIEAAGYGALWIPESLGSKEIFSHLALLLSGTSRIVVASGIANVYARDPVAMANGERTLADWFPGRFVLGLGVSHAPVVKQRTGKDYAPPVATMRAYLDAMDAAPYVGPKPAGPASRVLAALGPQMLKLAGERTAGAHPYFVPVEHTPIAREALGSGPVLAVEQAVTLETDPGKARAIARAHMKRYLELDNYRNSLRRLGWSEDDFANAGSDRLVDAIVAWGDEGAIRERVEGHLARGADHVCLQILTADRNALPRDELRRLARVVRRP